MIAIINNWQSWPFKKLSSWQAGRKNRTSLASNCTASWLNYCEQSQIAKVTTLINSRAARMQPEPIFPLTRVPAIACSGRQVIPCCKLPLSKRRMKWFRTEQTVDLFARFFRRSIERSLAAAVALIREWVVACAAAATVLMKQFGTAAAMVIDCSIRLMRSLLFRCARSQKEREIFHARSASFFSCHSLLPITKLS